MSSRTHRALFSLAGFTLLAAAYVGLNGALTARIERAAVQAGATVGAITADPLSGRIVLHDLALPFAEGAARVGRITLHSPLALVSPAVAAETVTLTDVSIEAGSATYRMPKIEVAGSSLGEPDLRALFDKAAAERLAARLAALSAAAVSIPELVVEQTLPSGKQTTVYRDIALRGIAAGKVDAATATGASLKSPGGKAGPLEGAFGPIAIRDLDLVLMTRLYADKAGPDEKEPKLLYSAVSMETIAFKVDGGGKIDLARVVGRDFKARPTETPWLETMRLLGETEDFDKLPAAERARIGAAMIDLYEAFDIGLLEFVGITIAGPPSDPAEGGRIARIAFTGGATPEIRVEGVDVTTPEAKVRLGLLSFSGFSLKPTLAAMKEHLAKPDARPEDVDARRFIPEFGTIRMADISADVAQEAHEAGGERIKLSIGGVEAIIGKPLNGIPTALRAGASHIVFAIPPKSQESGLKDLIEMGYATLDLSFLKDAAWNEPGKEVVVREMSLSGVDMGAIALRGTIGNVARDVFSPDSAVAQVALVGATLKTAHLTIEDKGLIERAIAREARKQGRKPEELRAELGLAAAIAVPAMLGSSGGAKDVAGAVARFVAKPGRLEISIRTRDPAGLGLADFMATGGDPTALFERLEVTASAE